MRRKEVDLPPIPPEVAQRCFDMLDQNLIGNILRIGNLAHLAKIDLNKKLLPKQKNIHTFNIDAQGFRKTRNENPPTREIGVTS